MRRHTTCTWCECRFSACATACCISVGCCVEQCTSMQPSSRGIAYADLAFEIELLLAADFERALQAVRCRGDRAGDVRVVRAARQVHRRQHVLLLRMRVACGQHRRQRLDVEHVLRARGRAARRVARRGDHREHRLAEVAHFAVGEDRVVADDRAALVRAGDVGRARAPRRRRAARGCGRAACRAIGHARPATGRAPRAACRATSGDVVDVGRAAGHMQVRRFVRQALADHAGARLDGRGGIDEQARRPACSSRLDSSAERRCVLQRRPHVRLRGGERRRACASRARGAAAGCAPPAAGSRGSRAGRSAA